MIKIKPSEKSHKSRNQPKLITFLVANAIAITVLFIGIGTTVQILHDFGKGETAGLLRLIGLPAIASLAVGVLSWVVPTTWKETMVFWRSRERRLPSSEAFTKIAPADLRIDMAELSRRLGKLPTDYQKQSALWYSTYRKHSKDTAVNDANAAYLLYREMTAITPILLIAVPIIGTAANPSGARIALGILWVIFEYVLVMLAARHAGTRLVANVLAIEASSKEGPTKAPAKRAPRKKPDPKNASASET